MNLVNLVIGGAALVGASKFGPQIMRGWATRYGGKVGGQILGDAVKHFGLGMNFIPGVGPFNFLRKAFLGRGMSQAWKQIKGLASASMNKELTTAVEGLYGPATYTSLVRAAKRTLPSARAYDKNAYKAIKQAYFNLAKSLKSNPMRKAGELQKSWNAHLGGVENFGMNTSVHHLRGHLFDSIQRVNDLALQGAEADKLFGTALVSNAAVIGIPTLSSSLMTHAIGKTLFGRTQRRLRGYEA